MPRFKNGDNINNVNYDCDEQRFLIGFMAGFGFADPRKTAKARWRNRPNAMNYTIERIESQLFKIRHWKIQCSDYTEVPNVKGTWFIDAPYQFGGHCYKHSNKQINFTDLAVWCKSRLGQTIVCENTEATWMEFNPLAIQNVLSGKNQEAIWTNYPTHFNNIQQLLFNHGL